MKKADLSIMALALALTLGACGGKGTRLPVDARAGGDGRAIEAGSNDDAATLDAVVGGRVEVGGPADVAAIADGPATADSAASDALDVAAPPLDSAPDTAAPVDLSADGASSDDGPVPAEDRPATLDVAPDGLPPGDASLVLCLNTCLDLEREYQTAFTAATTCDPAAPGQCLQTTPRTLACAACSTPVNDRTALEAIRARWVAAGCDACNAFCPPIACPAPVAPSCTRTPVRTIGTCSTPFRFP